MAGLGDDLVSEHMEGGVRPMSSLRVAQQPMRQMPTEEDLLNMLRMRASVGGFNDAAMIDPYRRQLNTPEPPRPPKETMMDMIMGMLSSNMFSRPRGGR